MISMRRICRKCQIEYDGDPGSTLCPSCVKEGRSSTIRGRICRTCEQTFPGGPRAWYCPDCRRERKRDQSRGYSRRGPARAIGSIDRCILCGAEYTVNGARQRYCKECALAACREADRIQGREWYAEHGDPNRRRELRIAHTAEIACSICGKLFTPRGKSVTCSKACSTELAKRYTADWERSHREQRNQYRRELRRKNKEEP